MDALVRQGLASDERFADAYARKRAEAGYGPVRIRAELRQRGIEGGLVRDVLAAYESTWVDLARAASGTWNQSVRSGKWTPGAPEPLAWADRGRSTIAVRRRDGA